MQTTTRSPAELQNIIAKDKCLILFSGGQDSTTCLYWAKRRFEQVHVLNIDYGQRHAIEIESAKKIAAIANVAYHEIKTDILEKIDDSDLIGSKTGTFKYHRSSNKLPSSFVPGRNLLFLTISAAFAYKMNIFNIVTGVCEVDYSGYPDCRENTIKALESALSLGMDCRFTIHTPLMFLTKTETVKLSMHLKGCFEALAYSHTCYNGKIPPCGECPSCKLRAKGFKEAGVADPLLERIAP